MKLDDVKVCIKCRKVIRTKAQWYSGICCEPGIDTIYPLSSFKSLFDDLILRFARQMHHERNKGEEREP